MTLKRSLVFLVIAMLAIGLAACDRPLSTSVPPVPSATLASEVPPAGTGDVMEQLELFVTQTAMARDGQPGAQTTPAPETPADATPGGETPAGETPAVETPAGETPAAPGEATPSAPEAAQPTPAAPEQQPTAAPVQPTAPAVNVPPPTPGLPSTYTIRGGENPYCIARRFNLNPNELLRLNGLGNNTILYPGDTLNIPQTGNPFPGDRALQPHPTNYTVVAGDTIYSIACKFGDVSPDAIAMANNLSAPYNLQAGQTLRIP